MTDLINTNSCTIAEYIEKIKGLYSDSASPTDTLIVDLKNKVYFDNKPIKKAFMIKEQMNLYLYLSVLSI